MSDAQVPVPASSMPRVWADGAMALLSALTGQDEHADAFMARLLSLNDYAFFCEQMRLGGGVLRASVDEAV